MKSQIFVFLLTLLSLFCEQRNLDTYDIKCDSLDKIDSLIQNILLKPYLYSSGPGESRIDFIIENDIISKEKSYRNEFFEYIKVIEAEKSDSLKARIIKFDSINIANDYSNARVKVKYYSPPDKFNKRRLRNTITLKYIFDTTECKWLLTDSTILVH